VAHNHAFLTVEIIWLKVHQELIKCMTIAMYDYIWTLYADTYGHIVSCTKKFMETLHGETRDNVHVVAVLISFEFWAR